jgi:PAS domain S-box-containing protein
VLFILNSEFCIRASVPMAQSEQPESRPASAAEPPAGAAARGALSPALLGRLRAALVTSEQRFRLLFDHSVAGVYCTTLDGTILDCNDALAAMLGYASRADLLYQHASELYFSREDRSCFIAQLQRTGQLMNAEFTLRRHDGTALHILENVILVPGAGDMPTTIQGTAIDITERRRAEEALSTSEERHRSLADELRRLTQHLQSVREEERGRIAHELHDELGQALTALNLDLYWLRGRLAAHDTVLHARVDSMLVLVRRTIDALRRICADLHPALLNDLGLTAALEWEARAFETRTGIRCAVHLSAAAPALPPALATAVFRICQESLTNITRHARARRVELTLATTRDELLLRVSDDGVGIAPEHNAAAGSLGIAGMRERALHWGGTLTIQGAPDAGTTVELRLPLRAPGGDRP